VRYVPTAVANAAEIERAGAPLPSDTTSPLLGFAASGALSPAALSRTTAMADPVSDVVFADRLLRPHAASTIAIVAACAPIRIEIIVPLQFV